jgi:hypothetical protein
MARADANRGKIMSDASVITGFAAGMLIMYVTRLMVPS